ncbi:MAG: dTDP-4-dehydrorhamnose 3,5-epimerase [Bacteroidaceae bacterium]|nr:dTDP-4-dehydrorhamnose 3,5-epimerase [Bacteroidaceae bacterium]MDO5489132.1 dTDP-4-dehydrorhamnose 3,5-epimerase [Bacteroidaceae bacterium]
MEYIKTHIEGVFVLQPKVFGDARGYFMETFRQEEFDSMVAPVRFVQDNESKSTRGVLRGLHYQKGAYSQAKLVRVIQGRVLDVAVDLRKSSPTFLQHVAVELSGENKRQLFVPRGFAHGFVVLSDEAVFCYKVDNVYAPQAECCIRYDDPAIGVEWPLPAEELLLSAKDAQGISVHEAELFI